MEHGDDNLDPEFDLGLIALGATNSSSTFCSDSDLGLQAIEAVEFSDSTKAADVIEGGMFFDALTGTAGSQIDAHGDIRCQSFIDEDENESRCVPWRRTILSSLPSVIQNLIQNISSKTGSFRWWDGRKEADRCVCRKPS